MAAGAPLAAAADRAWAGGLGRLSDGELAGLLAAARRNASRQAALELAVITELAARRARPDGVPGEHLSDEIAALLTLTGWAADRQVALAAAVARLPAVTAALAAGRIDAAKAGVLAEELALVDDDRLAAAIAAGLIGGAAGWNTSQIRREARHDIAFLDPAAAARRKQKARQDARVQVWLDPDGTGAIAGRGLDPAATIIAGENLDAAARWLKQHGAPGTMDQLRAEALLARLNSHDLARLLPPPPASPAADPAPPPGAHQPGAPGAPGAPGGLGGSVNLTMPAAAWLATVTITPIETGTCAHRRESAGYRPSPALRHIVKIRSPRCGYPGCGRPAQRCDDDHTIPHHKGGKTCECNMHPLCRRHHRTKQARGWHLAQPEPGILIWTLPSGRTITTTPEPYPA